MQDQVQLSSTEPIMRDQGQRHLRQRGEKAWELKFDLGRDSVSGKRLSRYVNFHGTKREAQAELNRLLNRRNEGTYVDPTKMTVAEYLEHWLTVERGKPRNAIAGLFSTILFHALGRCRYVSSPPFISKRLKQNCSGKGANAIAIV